MTIDDWLDEIKKENLCPAKEDCLFYQKPEYHSETEKMFLVHYCLRGGEYNGQTCGLKRNYDKTNELKNKTDFPRDKRTWRSK